MENNWTTSRIDEIATVKSGKRLPKGESLTNKKTDYPYIRLIDIEQGGVNASKIQYLEKKTQAKIGKYIVETDDVCLAIVGHTIGVVFYIDEKWNKANLTENAARLTAISPSFNSRYIYYYLTSPIGQSDIVSRKVGSAQGKLPLYNIKALEIKAPDRITQDRIVDILSSLDNKITLNRQTNQTLEQMAQALFMSWFVDFDPVVDNALDAGFFEQDLAFSDELLRRAEARRAVREHGDFKPLPDAICQLFPAAFEECVEPSVGLGGWVPKGWNPSNIGTEFDVTMGQSPPGSTYNEIGEGMPFFQGKTDFGFRFPCNRVYCTDPKRMARKNDTLVSVRAPVGDINLAAEDCAIGRGIAAVRHKSGSISFSYYAMNNLSTYFKVFEGEGTVFGSINQKDFKELPLIKCPAQVVSKFDEFCGCWDKRIENIAIEVAALTKLRDTLLPKLISGELRLDNISAVLANEGAA